MLGTRMVINALKKALMVAKPQILNSNQGCQFTNQQYIDFVRENGTRQSMDGKSPWASGSHSGNRCLLKRSLPTYHLPYQDFYG